MSTYSELVEALRKLVNTGVGIFPAVVKSVDKEKGFCSVEYGKLEYTEVRLTAVIDDNKNQILTLPKVGSWVLVGMIENDIHRLYVNSYSEVEALRLVVEDTEFVIDKSGYKISREDKDLNTLLSDLIDAITAIVVVQGKGPDIGKLQTIKQDLNTILAT